MRKHLTRWTVIYGWMVFVLWVLTTWFKHDPLTALWVSALFGAMVSVIPFAFATLYQLVLKEK